MLLVTTPVMSESCCTGQREKLNCDVIAVGSTLRSGAVMFFTVVLIESRAFVLQHHHSLEADASRKGDVYSFSLE